MALMDILSSLLSPGQAAGAIAPGQATGPGAQANFPISELLAQSQQREPSPNSVTPLTVTAPSGGRISAPSASVASAAAAPSAQGMSGTDQQLMSGVPGDPTFDNGAPQNPQQPSINYNNSGSSKAVNDALTAEGPPRGGMANPGLYGMLPQGLQHGTLRNVLGALGDALLVSGGRQPAYEDRMQNQEIGQAMAGMDINDPQSVAAAVQRVAATGAKGAPEMADKLQQQAEQAALRKQYMQYNQDYREQLIGSKHDVLYQRMYPAVMADLAQATNSDDYAQKLSMWGQRVKAIDPNADVLSAFGVPLNYTPGLITSTSGMTNDQIGKQALTHEGHVMTQQNSQGRDQAIVAAGAGRNAAMRYSADRSATKPTEAGLVSQIMSIPPEQRTPDQEQYLQSHSQISSRSRRAVPTGAGAGGVPIQRTTDPSQMIGTGPNGALQTLSADQASQYAKRGLHVRFIGNDGKHYHT